MFVIFYYRILTPASQAHTVSVVKAPHNNSASLQLYIINDDSHLKHRKPHSSWRISPAPSFHFHGVSDANPVSLECWAELRIGSPGIGTECYGVSETRSRRLCLNNAFPSEISNASEKQTWGFWFVQWFEWVQWHRLDQNSMRSISQLMIRNLFRQMSLHLSVQSKIPPDFVLARESLL